jgi:pimeloyl-ACP methyl ester carboxylesterase
MEGRVFAISSRNQTPLHAVLYAADRKPAADLRPALIILCHGFKGDKSEKDRFVVTAQQLNRNGFHTLIFDFSGSGENRREPILLSRQVTDLEDVARWAADNGYGDIGTIGLSFGGITSLMADLPNRKAAVFWSPAMYPRQSASFFENLLAKVMLRFPSMTVKRPSSGNYPPVIVKGAFTREVFALDTDSYLNQFTIPSLILQGSRDTVVKPENTRRAFSQMPRNSDHQYIAVEGAAHDFDGIHLTPFVRHSVAWFLKYLSPAGT